MSQQMLREGVSLGPLRRRFLTKSLPIPGIAMETKMNEQVISNVIEGAARQFSEKMANAFADEAKRTMKDRIANFSEGGDLWRAVESVVYQEAGIWVARIGIGVKTGKVPLNEQDEPQPYAFFVDRGTKPSKGRYVPKMSEVELWDLKDPTRRVKYTIPSDWVPKFTPGVNELDRRWIEARRKRPLIKKGAKKIHGKYFRTTQKPIKFKPFRRSRKEFKKHYPTYDITSLNMPDLNLPFAQSNDVFFGSTELDMEVFRGYSTNLRSPGTDDDKVYLELKDPVTGAPEIVAVPVQYTPFVENYMTVFGGEMRGYGGIGNILRSAGDISYAGTFLNMRTIVQELGGTEGGWSRLALGFPENIGTSVKEKGLGLRLKKDGAANFIGEHPGTPARNYIYNTAQHMKRWINSLKSRHGGKIPKGKFKGLRMT